MKPYISEGILYAINKNGQPEKVQITKSFWHKTYVFLFSRLETYGFWSTHKTEDDRNKGGDYYKIMFRDEHYRQVLGMYEEAVREEGLVLAQTEQVIDDRVAESIEIINSSKK